MTDVSAKKSDKVVELFDNPIETITSTGKRVGLITLSQAGRRQMVARTKRELQQLDGRSISDQVILFTDYKDEAITPIHNLLIGVVNTYPEKFGLCLVPVDTDVPDQGRIRRVNFTLFAGYDHPEVIASQSRGVIELADAILEGVGSEIRLA